MIIGIHFEYYIIYDLITINKVILVIIRIININSYAKTDTRSNNIKLVLFDSHIINLSLSYYHSYCNNFS